MSKLVKNEDAFTGLEAAIVLIAFIVVAAVFSYVMLGAGSPVCPGRRGDPCPPLRGPGGVPGRYQRYRGNIRGDAPYRVR